MASDKTPYKLMLSETARRALDVIAQPKANKNYFKKTNVETQLAIRRSNITTYFHSEYIDARPQWLKSARTWSVNERKFPTEVSLSKAQVAAVLKLSQEMDIDPKPAAKLSPSSRGVVGYLLTTFLDAVLVGYLISKRGQDETA